MTSEKTTVDGKSDNFLVVTPFLSPIILETLLYSMHDGRLVDDQHVHIIISMGGL